MSTRIYCFTGTGNSLFAAKTLRERLGGELRSLARTTAEDVASSDRVVLVFPAHMHRPPRPVVRFCDSLPRGSRVFVAVTHGGDPGGVLQRTGELLAGRGVEMPLGLGVEMIGNYTPFGGPGDAGVVKEKLVRAEARIEEIAVAMEQGRPRVDPPGGGIFHRAVHPGLFYRLGYWAIPSSDKRFQVNRACVGCGSCARVCPVDNISMENGKPRWHNRCAQCFGCLQWCEKEAVEMGASTVGVPRYRHPRISRKEVIALQGRRKLDPAPDGDGHPPA